MQKLLGQPSPSQAPAPLQPKVAPPSGTSLAAFMGGRATGPRLTRHAAQQDAHDPTQFEQRTQVTTPHPIFGRGGVAMPGMVAEARSPPAPSAPKQSPVLSSSPDVAPSAQRERTLSTPGGVRSIVARVEEKRAVTPQKTGSVYDGTYTARQRTISTPTGAFPTRRSTTPNPQPRIEESPVAPSISRPASRSPAPSLASAPLRPTTPNDRHQSLGTSPSPSSPKPPYSAPPPRSPSIPSFHQQSSSPSIKSQVSTPSLNRPIQPEPRRSLGGPQLPPMTSSSAAFLRAPTEKEPTPSISRLQGRGFVQNMVKASGQLNTTPTGAGSPVPRRTGTPEAGKKTSVMDRWQFDNGSSGSPSPPIISPKPIQTRKSQTFGSVQSNASGSSPVPTPFHPQIGPGKSPKPTSPLPFISHPGTPEPSTRISSSKSDVGAPPPSPRHKPPAGSSSTLISYIKPVKTGESPPVTSSPPTPAPRPRENPAPAVDELGVRIRPRSKSISAGASEEVQRQPLSANGERGDAGKPLSHVRSFW